jgi:hypothetical protein
MTINIQILILREWPDREVPAQEQMLIILTFLMMHVELTEGGIGMYDGHFALSTVVTDTTMVQVPFG